MFKGLTKLHLTDYLLHKSGINQWSYLDLCPSWKCNARCPTCESWKRNGGELSDAQAWQIISDKNFQYLRYVVIKGGEPTLWKPLGGFVEKLAQDPKRVISVITNGFLPDEVARLAEKWLPIKNQIRWIVPLNGIGEMHDASRGVKNVFKKTVTSANTVKKMGYITTFSFTPFKVNEDHFPRVKILSEVFGIPINVCYLCESGKFGSPKWKPSSHEKIVEMSSDGGYWDKLTRRCFFDSVEKKKVMPCWAGSSMIHINPEGLIRPCSMDKSMGIGMITKDETRIFGSNIKKYLKERIPEKCQYTTGSICNNCMISWTLRRSIPYLLNWRVGK